MAGLEANTESYNQPLPVSPLDIAKQIGGLQQQKLAIDQAKLDQANQGLTYMTRAVGSIGPGKPVEEYLKAGQDAVAAGLVPENMFHIYEQRMRASKDPYREFMSAAEQGLRQIEIHTGQNVSANSGNTEYYGKRDVISGAVKPVTQMALQPPPTQTTVNNQRTLPNGQPNPNYLQPGIIGASGPQGMVPSLPAAPPDPPAAASPARAPVTVDPKYRASLPAERPLAPGTVPAARVSGPTGPTVQTGHNFNERFSAAFPNSIPTGAPPGTAAAIAEVSQQSGKDFAADLTRAKSLQADLYPAERALEIVKELGPQGFGPGTEGLNTVKSAIATWLPNVDQKTIDGVSNFEQARKYLTQIARSSGATGTNDQLAAASEANPSVKMNSASIENVLKSVISLRKMQAAQTLMAANNNVPKEQYSEWIAKNQNQFDPRAFGVDMMDNKAKEKLYTELKKDKKAYQKFETTLQFANDAKLVGQ